MKISNKSIYISFYNAKVALLSATFFFKRHLLDKIILSGIQIIISYYTSVVQKVIIQHANNYGFWIIMGYSDT
jgi:hypothetical protein